ncbi:MAG: YddF family protein [Armatimonadota bacterium]
MVALLNAAILTAYGSYDYKPITVEEARALVSNGFVSYIGHESTAQVLSEILGVEVPVNRAVYVQQVGDRAIVFKLRDRLPAGQILERQQIEEIGYELGLLVRLR